MTDHALAAEWCRAFEVRAQIKGERGARRAVVSMSVVRRRYRVHSDRVRAPRTTGEVIRAWRRSSDWTRALIRGRVYAARWWAAAAEAGEAAEYHEDALLFAAHPPGRRGVA